jgi:site-specific DNA-methyltransferase (adenine-specific)
MPVLSLPLQQIIQGDCVNVLNTLPEKSVDLIFADPPYNLQLQQDLWRPNMTRVDAVNDEWDRFDSLAAYDVFTRAWLTACRRVLSDTGTLWVIGSYHNIYRIGSILMDLGYWMLNDVAWIKKNPMPQFRGVRFANAHETLLWVQKHQGARYTFNYQALKALNGDLQMRSDWVLPICSGKERIKIDGKKVHSTQKPEALLYRVIMASSNPGDVVLDPFFGTGTTGAVAKKLHREWIGIERDPLYIDVAQERIDTIAPQPYDEAVFDFPSKRALPRVPFGDLLHYELIQPGQVLVFDQQEDVTAVVLANGHLRYKDFTGSIHQVGKHINNGPCNGWQCWYYFDADTGQLEVIDRLRARIREWDDRQSEV